MATVSFSLTIGMTFLRQERFEGIAGVNVTAAVGQVGADQQHLGNGFTINVKVLVVNSHQTGLPNRRQHLLLGDKARQFGKIERFFTGRHCPGRYEHHLVIAGLQLRHLARQVHQVWVRQVRGPSGQGRSAQFYDDALKMHTLFPVKQSRKIAGLCKA